MKIIDTISRNITVFKSTQLCGLVRLQLSSTTGAVWKENCEGWFSVVASWLNGYGGYSQTLWVQVLQLLASLFFFFLPKQVVFQQNLYKYI